MLLRRGGWEVEGMINNGAGTMEEEQEWEQDEDE